MFTQEFFDPVPNNLILKSLFFGSGSNVESANFDSVKIDNGC